MLDCSKIMQITSSCPLSRMSVRNRWQQQAAAAWLGGSRLKFSMLYTKWSGRLVNGDNEDDEDDEDGEDGEDEVWRCWPEKK
mmetsp:Transcript_17588/g.24706  ORF Transcript_17588/g.24706 Transcript_17588/m.24706 type:complete len:82 (-) Transcript_17588:189-434(-)